MNLRTLKPSDLAMDAGPFHGGADMLGPQG